MQRQELVGLLKYLDEFVAFPLLPRVFVLPDDTLQPVCVVVEHDAKDGYALHHGTLVARQETLTLHPSSVYYSLSFLSEYEVDSSHTQD